MDNLKIIQCSNEPIVITISNDNLTGHTAMEASLYNLFRELKHWSKNNITVSGTTITLPLTEKDTKNFNEGKAKLEIKWLDASCNTKFAPVVEVEIEHREDKTIMGD